jgi:hypothetical protein
MHSFGKKEENEKAGNDSHDYFEFRFKAKSGKKIEGICACTFEPKLQNSFL